MIVAIVPYIHDVKDILDSKSGCTQHKISPFLLSYSVYEMEERVSVFYRLRSASIYRP